MRIEAQFVPDRQACALSTLPHYCAVRSIWLALLCSPESPLYGGRYAIGGQRSKSKFSPVDI